MAMTNTTEATTAPTLWERMTEELHFTFGYPYSEAVEAVSVYRSTLNSGLSLDSAMSAFMAHTSVTMDHLLDSIERAL